MDDQSGEGGIHTCARLNEIITHSSFVLLSFVVVIIIIIACFIIITIIITLPIAIIRPRPPSTTIARL